MAGSSGNSSRNRFEICSGDQRCLRRFSISARNRAFPRSFSTFDRWAKLAARASARHARYDSRPPFRRCSREIVEGARPRCRAIARSVCPLARPIPMASRSSRESCLQLRLIRRLPRPPRRRSARWMHFVEPPKAIATSRCVSLWRRRQTTSFLSASDSLLRLPSRYMPPAGLSITIPRCCIHRLKPPPVRLYRTRLSGRVGGLIRPPCG